MASEQVFHRNFKLPQPDLYAVRESTREVCLKYYENHDQTTGESIKSKRADTNFSVQLFCSITIVTQFTLHTHSDTMQYCTVGTNGRRNTNPRLFISQFLEAEGVAKRSRSLFCHNVSCFGDILD